MTEPSLLRQRRFAPMWLGQAFGALADNMNRQVLLVGVTFGSIHLAGVDNARSFIPIIATFFPIAMLVGSMYGGQFAEKYETSMMFRRTKFVELLLMILAAIGLVMRDGWILSAALFGMGLQSSFFNPVRQSAMPKYLETDELIRGNGLMNAGLYGCILLGYGIGGALLGIKPNGIYYAAIALVVFAAAGYYAVRYAPFAKPTNPDLKIDWTGIRPAYQMIKFTLGEAAVIRPLIGVIIFYYISTCVTVLLSIYVPETLGGDEFVLTVIMFLFAIGAGIGSIIAASMSKGRSGLGFATLGILMAAIFSLGVYFISTTFTAPPVDEHGVTVYFKVTEIFSKPNGILLAALLCLTSTAMGVYLAPLQAAMQRRAPDERRARILAVGNMSYAIAAILGSLSVLTFTEIPMLRPEHVFIGVAMILFIIAIYMIIRRNNVPAGLYDNALLTAKT